MIVVTSTAYALLAAGALLALARLVRGPSLLDRVIASEAVLIIVTAGLAAFAAFSRTTTVVPVLLVVSLLAFLGPIAVARYVGGMMIRSERGEDVEMSRPAEERSR